MDMQSKAKKLIEMIQTAPVEWKPLGEVCLIADNLRKPVKASLRVAGKIPYYGANNIQDYVDGYTHDGEFLLIAEDGSASLTNYSIQWVVGKFWANNHVHVVQGNKLLNNRFLFHYLRQMNFIPYLVGGDRAKLTKAKMLEIKIPIPPLETQQKIVKILDKFTELEATLEATLEAELALRKRQYRYYRDSLLDFDNQIGGGGIADGYQCRLKDVVWKTLGEVVNIKNGKDWKNLSSGDIPVYGSGGVMGYVDTFAYDKPSVLIPRKGSITNIFYVDFPFWNVDTIYYTEIDTSKLKPKFFYYFMRTIDLMALDTGSGRPSLTQTILNKIKIPIPPLPEQEKIVAILDKFDTLTHSISEGLPHEIALRRKQYEYYREQLLAFPKAA